jgi:dipeptidyl aminopeptidase/acylaminoacyl peptidase
MQPSETLHATMATPDADTATRTRRPMREDDLLSFVWIADPQMSPDGRRVAYTRVHVERDADEYRTAVWMVEVEGGAPRALTSGKWDAQPRWSPDGRWLAFVRKSAADEPAQLCVLPMEGGEARVLTTLAKGASSPAWSPDGRRIAFLSGTDPVLDEPRKEKPKNAPARVITRPVFRWNNEGFIDPEHLDHVWVVEADGGVARPLTRGRFVEQEPRWSRDGKRVLFLSDRREEPWFGNEESGVYAVPAGLETATDGDGLERLVDYAGPVRAYAETASGGIVTIGKVTGASMQTYDQMDVLLCGGPGTAPRRLNATRDHAFGETLAADQHAPRGGGEVPFRVGADGAVLALASREGGGVLVRVDPAGGAVKSLTPRDRDLVCGTATPDGRWWACVMGSVHTPGDLVLVDAASGVMRTLVAPNDALLAGIALGGVEEIWVDARDGKRLHGWVVTPPDFDPAKRHPMVLQIHGGPHTAYGAGFFHEFHVLAGAGYVVLYTNPRGSTSYGEDFATLIQYAYPGEDADDLMTCVDALVARGSVDPARLGITGGSGGGLLTNWIITRTDRFAAAISQRCVADWASMSWSSDFTLFTPFWFRKQPHVDPREYIDRSPVYGADRITTPLMVIHSEEDWRTPIGQGEAMFRALKFQRKPVVMVRFPGENHELSRSGVPSRRVQNQQHIRAWFDHWLQGRPAPQYGL